MNDMSFPFENIDPASFSYNDIRGVRRENLPRTKPRIATATANVNPLDDLILVDATAGAVTMTLETAIGCDGRRHIIKKSDSSGNAVTVACTGGQTIDGAATVSLAAQYDTIAVMSNGVNWEAVSQYPASGGGGGGGTTINSGSATLNFGAFPGSSEASVAVAAATVGAGAKARAYWRGDDTSADHTANDHKYAAALIGLSVLVTAGVGLTIYGRALDNAQGAWTVRYEWFN